MAASSPYNANLNAVMEKLQKQNNSYVEQLKDLTSRLNNLTVANNK